MDKIAAAKSELYRIVNDKNRTRIEKYCDVKKEIAHLEKVELDLLEEELNYDTAVFEANDINKIIQTFMNTVTLIVATAALYYNNHPITYTKYVNIFSSIYLICFVFWLMGTLISNYFRKERNKSKMILFVYKIARNELH